MKRIYLTVVLGVVAAMAFAPVAGASTPNTLEVNGGYAKSSDDATGAGDKMSGGLSFGGAFWRSASPTVSWGVEMSYDNMGNVKYDNGLTTNNEASAHIMRINPAIRFNFGKGIGPNFYAQTGAGFYNVTAKLDDSFFGNIQNTDAKFGFNAGAGMSFPMGEKARLNFNGLWHNVSMNPDNVHYLQFRAGVGFGI